MATHMVLIMMSIIPMLRTVGTREGGSMKFGGSPFGFKARGVFNGSSEAAIAVWRAPSRVKERTRDGNNRR